MINYIKLIASLVICQAAGFIGSLFTIGSVDTWYSTLIRPEFSPPNWVFGPVWTILYVLMGISLYIIWEHKYNTKALWLFGTQLVLNSLWSIIFFGLQSPFYAFIEIIILWAIILWTIIESYKVSKNAAYLLVPYILWVSFAMILNFSIFYLNM